MTTTGNRFPPLVIRASAGTGKTYQLSTRYLELAATGRAPDTILATTFTRKAAGEILARILQRLAEAADDPAKLSQTAAAIREPSFDRARCLDLLESMVRQLHRLRVSTLDSFFIQLARSFGLELSLPPGWRIVDELEDALLREEAVRRMLGSESTEDVVRLMHLLTKGEATASVALQIHRLVASLYTVYQETSAEAWSRLTPPSLPDPREVVAARAFLECAALPSDKRYGQARAKSVAAFDAEQWETFLGKGFVAKIAAGETTFYGKEIPPPVVEACQTMLQHVRAVLLHRLAQQTEATYRLLERFDRAYSRLKASRRAMRFDDIARSVSNAWDAERLDEVFFRLDSHLGHLLLDEFQDTSGVQWRVLRPFAQRVTADPRTRSFFCVGDVKQAIYGWRGGVAEIFDAIGDELPGLTTSPLNESRRSSPVIMATTNKVFEPLAYNGALTSHGEAAASWAGRFATHSTFHADRPGYCRLVTPPVVTHGELRSDGTRPATPPHGPDHTLRFAAEEIRRLHEESPGFSIGVLVRRNLSVAKLMYYLRECGVEASEEGGNSLDDSPAVELVLSLLTLADHPGDTVVRYHLAKSPIAEQLGLTSHADDAAARRLAAEYRRRLVEDGYGPTIYRVVELLAPHCDARDLGRLMQLVETAYAREADATLRTDDFVRAVRTQRVESPRATDVRVMTIHQSKGLEFDIVVLPELDAALRGQPPQIVVHRAGPTAPIDCVLRYASKDVQSLLPDRFQRMFADQKRTNVEEALCVLYVALTRAVHALHLIVAPSSEGEKALPCTFAGLLRGALTAGDPLRPGTTAYEDGDPRWFAGVAPRSHHAASEERPSPVVRLAPPASRPTRHVERRTPSSMEGGATVSLAAALRLDGAESLRRGTTFHAWFELIEWLEDGLPTDEALRAAAVRVDAPLQHVEAWSAAFREAAVRPDVAAVLSRARTTPSARPVDPKRDPLAAAAQRLTDPQWTVEREAAFAVRDGEAILTGSIDRLVIVSESGRVVAAEVTDYKTDAIAASDAAALEARTAFYRPQLAAYRRATAQRFGISPDDVSTLLVFTEPGIVRRVY